MRERQAMLRASLSRAFENVFISFKVRRNNAIIAVWIKFVFVSAVVKDNFIFIFNFFFYLKFLFKF